MMWINILVTDGVVPLSSSGSAGSTNCEVSNLDIHCRTVIWIPSEKICRPCTNESSCWWLNIRAVQKSNTLLRTWTITWDSSKTGNLDKSVAEPARVKLLGNEISPCMYTSSDWIFNVRVGSTVFLFGVTWVASCASANAAPINFAKLISDLVLIFAFLAALIPWQIF